MKPDERNGRIAALLTELVDLLADDIADRVGERLGRARFLTVPMMTAEFGLSPRAIRTARQRGEIHGRRVGHALVFARADVECWLGGPPTESRTTPGSDPFRRPDGSLDVEAATELSLARAGIVRKGGLSKTLTPEQRSAIQSALATHRIESSRR